MAYGIVAIPFCFGGNITRLYWFVATRLRYNLNKFEVQRESPLVGITWYLEAIANYDVWAHMRGCNYDFLPTVLRSKEALLVGDVNQASQDIVLNNIKLGWNSQKIGIFGPTGVSVQTAQLWGSDQGCIGTM